MISKSSCCLRQQSPRCLSPALRILWTWRPAPQSDDRCAGSRCDIAKCRGLPVEYAFVREGFGIAESQAAHCRLRVLKYGRRESKSHRMLQRIAWNRCGGAGVCWLGKISTRCQQAVPSGMFTVDGFEACVTEVHCDDKTAGSCTVKSQMCAEVKECHGLSDTYLCGG